MIVKGAVATTIVIIVTMWVSIIKLGHLVKNGKIKTIEKIYLFSLSIKEYQIINFFFSKLKNEVIKIISTHTSQYTHFKIFVIIGNFNEYIDLSIKYSKKVTTAIYSTIIFAKLSVISIYLSYWSSTLSEPYTISSKVTDKYNSSICYLISALCDTSIVLTDITNYYTTFYNSTIPWTIFATIDNIYTFLTSNFLFQKYTNFLTQK
ncbi:LOW QUALITY PROTEIN: hypothetical protein BC936DRAFT_138763, partial [Jimgerdemannia flammicorona]